PDHFYTLHLLVLEECLQFIAAGFVHSYVCAVFVLRIENTSSTSSYIYIINIAINEISIEGSTGYLIVNPFFRMIDDKAVVEDLQQIRLRIPCVHVHCISGDL